MFGRIPPVFLWIAIAISLFMNVVNINLIGMASSNSKKNDRILCIASGKTTVAVNDAHLSITDLITKTRDNALSRINTPKELPTDKASVTYFSHFLSTIHTTTPLNCQALK